jgi:glycosyltransferase involved in cell wall biosynthesis
MAVIRVLQVFTIMDRGGAESMIMSYYRQLDKSKVQFDFLVHRPEKGAYENEIEQLGGHIYKLPTINPLNPIPYYNNLRAFFKAHPYYKIIHSHINTFSAFPLKIAKEFEIPCRIAHAHIAMEKFTLSYLFIKNERTTDKLKKIVKLFLRRRISKYPTHYFSCGQKAGKWLFGNTPFKTMNNAIDSEKFKYNTILEQNYKKKFNITNEFIIGHIGRFDTQKNHVFLLQIFSSLLKKHPNSKLLLIGDGPLKKFIEETAKNLLITNSIDFLGVRDDIPNLFQIMDVFVFPSLFEGLPVTLIEAQASGTKIVASDTISDEVNLTGLIDFLSLRETPEFWANKIGEIKKTKIIKMDLKNSIVKHGYDIVSNAKKMETFYLQQISR